MSDYLSIKTTEDILIKRVLCEYSFEEQEIMKRRKANILNEIEILKLTRKSIIHNNQEIIALKVVTAFKNKKIINIMVLSKTQSGKTGSMIASIKQYLEDTSNSIPIENIYIITGLSSCEWKEQTKERMPESIQARVYHRDELPNTFVDEIKDKKNILIIMDEIQVAAKKGQTIYKTFENAGLLNKQKLYENDIKILEYTATPDGTIYDLVKWKDASSKILADVGEGYVSSYDLLRSGRVKQFKDLCGYNKDTKTVDEIVFRNIQELKNDIDNYEFPLYHIIRTKGGLMQDITIDNFNRIFENRNYKFIKYDKDSDIKDINKILIKCPTEHTIIFIKEKLRCAKTLKKKYIGVTYERHSKNPDDAAIMQGLLGRNTGYDDNGFSICYTNIESIEKYEKLWNSNFEDTTVKWNSKTTKCTDGVLTGYNTFNNPAEYDGFSVESDDSIEPIEPIIAKFNTQEEAKKYYIDELKPFIGGRGPNKKTPNANGFYEATIRKITKVHSCEEIYAERKCNIDNGAGYAIRPCYEDVNNKSTLQWWMIHYSKN